MSTPYTLHASHREVLEWFQLNADREFVQRPFDEGLSIKVTHLKKGIWKSKLTPYAISVVETHTGIYNDLDVIPSNDGTWTYFYHQQGTSAEDLRNPERIPENAALMRCEADGVPVGVIIPAESGQGYRVLGLAFVEKSYTPGYFKLVGPVSIGAIASGNDLAESREAITAALIGLPIDGFDPHSVRDGRLTVIQSVHRRQGGPRFRRALLHAYEGRCAMTRYDAVPALDAAHIIPYRGPQTNHPANGLLLRADMHDLFDLGLLCVDPGSMRLRLSGELVGTEYEHYEGVPLWIPKDEAARPSEEALAMHMAQSAVA